MKQPEKSRFRRRVVDSWRSTVLGLLLLAGGIGLMFVDARPQHEVQKGVAITTMLTLGFGLLGYREAGK